MLQENICLRANDCKVSLAAVHLHVLTPVNASCCVNSVLTRKRNAKRVSMKRKINVAKHYENTPIQIYRKFHLQKLKIFR